MAEKVNLDNAVDWNDYGVSVEGQPQVNIRGGQETPEWFDYEAYRKSQGKEGDWSAPEMKNPDTLTKIRSALARVKEAPEVLGYAAHKVADPMYANVDYMGQQVGDWAAKKINNIARAFDVSPEARQYGRFEEEEYDPEAVDVRFGRNAYKEGYDNLGDYLEAKDQEKVDRYRGYNHANRFAPIENADEQFYTLSDTQTMEDWQPETTSGKIAKGAIETAGNMLPENLKALMEEKGIEGGAKMLGMLTPLGQKIARQKARAKAFRNGEITELGEMTPEQNARWANVGDELASENFRNFKEDDLAIRYGKKIDPEGYAKVKATMSPDEAEEYARLTGYGRPGAAEARVRNVQAERKALDAFRRKVNRDLAEGRKVEDTLKELSGANRKGYEYRFNPNDPYGHLIPFEGEDSEQIAKSIVRSSQKQPKPMPDPELQRIAGKDYKRVRQVLDMDADLAEQYEQLPYAAKQRAIREALDGEKVADLYDLGGEINPNPLHNEMVGTIENEFDDLQEALKNARKSAQNRVARESIAADIAKRRAAEKISEYGDRLNFDEL